MSVISSGFYIRLLVGWVDLVRRFAALVTVAAVAATVACGWYVASNLAIDTSTTDMLSPELPFRQDSKRLDRAFPQFVDNIVVVIDAATADQADDAAAELTARLGRQPEIFRAVLDPAGDPFLRRNGLLFLEPDELAELIDRLASAQAFLGTLWRDPSLRGLFKVLGLALEEEAGDAAPVEIGIVLGAIAATVEDQIAGRPGILSWREIMEGKTLGPADRRRVIVVQPVLDYGSLLPAKTAIDAIRRVARDLGPVSRTGVRIRLTGSAPLAEEELESTLQGMEFAALLSLVLVISLLFWGLRSPRMAGATIATLLMGLIWTAGFATAAVGRLNLISVAFAVLFIGLSVDFGIHFALRYREALDRGTGHAEALAQAAGGAGGALTLCAFAAAIGFLSFLPTDYLGLAELGLISGGGMFIALFANLTVLPAILSLAPPPPLAPEALGPAGSFTLQAVMHKPRRVIAGAIAAAVIAGALLPQARFDFDPLNLKDPDTESVSTLFDLMGDKDAPPYSLTVLADSLDAAIALGARAGRLDEVRDTVTLASLVPKAQEEKLLMIESAALFLLPAFAEERRPPSADAAARRRAVSSFRRKLAAFIAAAGPAAAPGTVASARRLAGALARLDAGRLPGAAGLAEMERRLLASLPARLDALRLSLDAGPVTLGGLPERLRRRHVAANGEARLEIFPREDLRDRARLVRFVDAVRTLAPRVTGSPVTILEAGRVVVNAFLQAAVISVVLISLLIAVLLRRLHDVLLVFLPLALAALLTIAMSVLLDIPFNFANVIVLPLLFGLGVASGIHLVLRAREASDYTGLLVTSTPRAVVFSALTTIGSFGSIALSSHPGTSSMGILLTIAITATLVCTLVVLPALLAAFGVGKAATP